MSRAQLEAEYQRRAAQWLSGDATAARMHVCNCIGPQHGNPVCPCRMKNLTIHEGRFVEIIDHGPTTEQGE